MIIVHSCEFIWGRLEVRQLAPNCKPDSIVRGRITKRLVYDISRHMIYALWKLLESLPVVVLY